MDRASVVLADVEEIAGDFELFEEKLADLLPKNNKNSKNEVC